MAQRFAGYAALFDRPDKGGDVIRKGAFAGARAGLPVFWQHDPKRRMGTVEAIGEDDRGLRVVAQLDQRADVQSGHGLSFGYRVRKSRTSRHRELLALDLIEISLVDHPMQPLARVLAVEPALGPG